jgi:dihydrodipicolinate synthase/N-acetylneuraminate lyase
MSIDWSGIFHILATPFTDDAALDLDGVPKLIDSVLATGVRGITMLGIAGEAHRLNDVIRYESQPGALPGSSIAIRKEIFRRRGWIASARVRPPAAALDAATLEELTELLSVVATS